MTDNLKKVLTEEEQRYLSIPAFQDFHGMHAIISRLASRVVKLEEENINLKKELSIALYAVNGDPELKPLIERSVVMPPPAAKEEVRGTRHYEEDAIVLQIGNDLYHRWTGEWSGPDDFTHYDCVLTPTELAPHLESLRAWLAKGGA